MIDTAPTVSWDGADLPYRSDIPHEDARLLGDILHRGAVYSHQNKIKRVAIHRVYEQRFLTVSGGKPFKVQTYELRGDGVGQPLKGELPGVSEATMNLVFSAEDTGDGITFFFKDSDFRPLTQVVANAAKDQAHTR